MDNGAERGMKMEVVVLDGNPLGFLKVANMSTSSFQDVGKFGRGICMNSFEGAGVPC